MPSVLAIAAHPDDIEFVMAGTLLRLRSIGWDVHYFNVASGCCGSMTTGPIETAAIRLREAEQAASIVNASFYPPICDDMGVFYTPENLSKVVSVMRRSNPSIVLTHSPIDYMEDHEATCRLAVSAAFVKGMPNFRCHDNMPHAIGPVAIYHAQPHSNRTPLNQPVTPDIFVDITSVLDMKVKLLECHASQRGWLDTTQAMSSYVQNMIEAGRELGLMSNRFEYCEGFRKHLHLGFASEDFNPLFDLID